MVALEWAILQFTRGPTEKRLCTIDDMKQACTVVQERRKTYMDEQESRTGVACHSTTWHTVLCGNPSSIPNPVSRTRDKRPVAANPAAPPDTATSERDLCRAFLRWIQRGGDGSELGAAECAALWQACCRNEFAKSIYGLSLMRVDVERIYGHPVDPASDDYEHRKRLWLTDTVRGSACIARTTVCFQSVVCHGDR